MPREVSHDGLGGGPVPRQLGSMPDEAQQITGGGLTASSRMTALKTDVLLTRSRSLMTQRKEGCH